MLVQLTSDKTCINLIFWEINTTQLEELKAYANILKNRELNKWLAETTEAKIEKIKEILIESELMEAIGENVYEEDNWEPYVIKFAELIVQKCCDVIGNGDSSMSSSAEHGWRETCQIEIKQLFGL